MEAFGARTVFIIGTVFLFLIFNIECLYHPLLMGPLDACTFRLSSMNNITEEVLCRNSTVWTQRPVKDTNTILNVFTRYLPTSIKLYESEEYVILDGFLNASWKNEFVSWNPSEYGSVSEITTNGAFLWRPVQSTRMFDSWKYLRTSSIDDYYPTFDEAIIHSSGLVTLKSTAQLGGLCQHDARAWPFGQWKCRISLVRVPDYKENVKLAPFDPLKDIDVSGLDNNDFWIIASKPHFTVVDSTNSTIDVSFAVKRNSLTYGSAVILPGMVSLLLSLASFWLTDQIYYRVMINTVTATIQLALLLFMLWLLKESGTKGNLFMRLLEESALISLMGILLAIVNAKLMGKITEPPKYILRTIDGVGSMPYVGPVLRNFISDDNLVSGDDEVALVPTSRKDNAEWKTVRVALDKCIFILLVLHFLIFCLF